MVISPFRILLTRLPNKNIKIKNKDIQLERNLVYQLVLAKPVSDKGLEHVPLRFGAGA